MKTIYEKFKQFFFPHHNLAAFALASLLILGLAYLFGGPGVQYILVGYAQLWIMIYPFLTSLIQLRHFRKKQLSGKEKVLLHLNDLLTIGIGASLSRWALDFFIEREVWPDWQVQILSTERHSPIWTEAFPTLWIWAGLGLLGYLLLTYIPIRRMSPILLAFSLAACYLGLGLIIIMAIQIGWGLLFGIGLYLANLVLIYYRILYQTILAWRQEHLDSLLSATRFPGLKRLLATSWGLPSLGLIALLPLLGLLIVFLTLFGQEPDAMIKAWTETSDWTLSTKISPPSVFHDQHYLCTVGAAGHRRLVRPVRMGVRQGHTITVTRQLLIANAFEDLIAQQMPGTHQAIRHFYDRYGYPIARHIRKAWQADLVYLLMKPLEWLFLVYLYLFDQKPENRIAVQYLPKT